jgi:hypothetical protein
VILNRKHGTPRVLFEILVFQTIMNRAPTTMDITKKQRMLLMYILSSRASMRISTNYDDSYYSI